MRVEEESEKTGLKLNTKKKNKKTKIMALGPITSWQIEGADFIFLGSKSHCEWRMQSWNTKMLTPWKESYDKCRQCIKKLRHHFANKGPYSQSYGFSSIYIRMGELDHKESWAPQN